MAHMPYREWVRGPGILLLKRVCYCFIVQIRTDSAEYEFVGLWRKASRAIASSPRFTRLCGSEDGAKTSSMNPGARG